MSATIQWNEYNGVGQVETPAISNLNAGAVDAPNLNPADNPIVAGTNSFFKMIKIEFGGTFTKVSNFKCWKSAGTFVTGETLKFDNEATYTQPDQTDIVAGLGAGDIPTAEPGSSNVTPAEITVAGGKTDFLVFQVQTTGSSPAGATNTKTITFQYDEI